MANTIKTRILNKYDVLANYNTFKPLKGEICIAEVATVQKPTEVATGFDGQTYDERPIVGIKVGDGQHTFAELPWVQAAAGDVSSFVKGIVDEAKFNELVNALITTGIAQLATKAELKIVSDKLDLEAGKIVTLQGDVSTLKGIVETGSNSNANLRAAINSVLGTADDNSSANTVYGAKKYAEEKADAAKQAAITAAGTAADAKYELIGVAEDKVKALSDSVDGKIGTTAYVGGTLTQAIANLQASVGTSGEGLGAQVAALRDDVDEHETKIGNLETAVGDSTKGLVKDVADLQATIADSGDFGKRVVALEGEMDVVQAATAGYDASNTIAGAIEDVADVADAAKSLAEENKTKVNTLIGSDSSKSVRDIAIAVLTEKLIPENANEARDTLEEIAAWIQSHPNDASAMNNAIKAVKENLGYTGDNLETAPDTVDTRITTAISDLETKINIGNYATKGELTGVSDRVDNILKADTGAIATAKKEVIGASGDAKTADTIYGAKAYADDVAKSKADAAQAAAEATAKADATAKANAAQAAAEQKVTELANGAVATNAQGIVNVNDRIDGLDYTDSEDGVVATVTQTDGQISVTHKKVGVADLADEVFVFYCGNATGYADDMKTVNI